MLEFGGVSADELMTVMIHSIRIATLDIKLKRRSMRVYNRLHAFFPIVRGSVFSTSISLSCVG